jgi:hypothetical protein
VEHWDFEIGIILIWGRVGKGRIVPFAVCSSHDLRRDTLPRKTDVLDGGFYKIAQVQIYNIGQGNLRSKILFQEEWKPVHRITASASRTLPSLVEIVRPSSLKDATLVGAISSILPFETIAWKAVSMPVPSSFCVRPQ